MSVMATRQQAGASCSCATLCSQARGSLRPGLRYQRRINPNDIICASSGSSGSPEGFAQDARTAASRVFKKAQKKWDTFTKDQRLKQRANEAFDTAITSAREATDKAKEKARRVFVQLDSEYELTSKTARAARRAEEVARDIDQTYGIRRRARSTGDYIARSWPIWQRQLDEFGSTWYGKITVFMALCLLLSSPLFWSVLNVLLLLWWLSVPVGVLMLNYAREQQAQRQREAAEEEARRSANPFADLFRGAWAGASASSGRSGGSRTAGPFGRNRYREQDGPIIDAEWKTIDEDDAPSSRHAGRKK